MTPEQAQSWGESYNSGVPIPKAPPVIRDLGEREADRREALGDGFKDSETRQVHERYRAAATPVPFNVRPEETQEARNRWHGIATDRDERGGLESRYQDAYGHTPDVPAMNEFRAREQGYTSYDAMTKDKKFENRDFRGFDGQRYQAEQHNSPQYQDWLGKQQANDRPQGIAQGLQGQRGAGIAGQSSQGVTGGLQQPGGNWTRDSHGVFHQPITKNKDLYASDTNIVGGENFKPQTVDWTQRRDMTPRQERELDAQNRQIGRQGDRQRAAAARELGQRETDRQAGRPAPVAPAFQGNDPWNNPPGTTTRRTGQTTHTPYNPNHTVGQSYPTISQSPAPPTSNALAGQGRSSYGSPPTVTRNSSQSSRPQRRMGRPGRF